MKNKYRGIISFVIYFICIALLIPAFFLTELVYSYTPQESSTSIKDTVKIFGIQLIISVILFLIEVLIEIYILISANFEKTDDKHKLRALNYL